MRSLTRHQLSVEDGQLPLSVVRSDALGATVVIIPSAFGVGPDLEAQMEELGADAGLVVALDPFFREGAGFVPYDDRPRVMARLGALERERSYRDLTAAIAWARAEQEGRPVIVVGICFGGPFALRAAADGLVDGVVTWHGSRLENHLERAAEIKVPLRFHFGAADPVTPPPVIEAVQHAFAGRDARVAVHEGAVHGFSHRDSPAYDERAERAGMDAVRELIARHRA